MDPPRVTISIVYASSSQLSGTIPGLGGMTSNETGKTGAGVEAREPPALALSGTSLCGVALLGTSWFEDLAGVEAPVLGLAA